MKKLIYALVAFAFFSSFSAYADNVLVAPTPDKPFKVDKKLDGEKYYMIFDNLDVVKNIDGETVSNAFDLLYWNGLKNYPSSMDDYQKYFVRVPFDNNTLSTYNIVQDFDVLIIPLGDYPLNVGTQSGKKIITLVKEMLAAGKSVFISGRNILKYAFYNDPQLAAGKDPEVITWLTEDVGIEQYSLRPQIVQNGNQYQYVGYKLFTKQSDPLGKGYDKYMNQIFTTGQNAEEHGPISWYSLIEFVAKFKDGSKSIPLDHVDTLLQSKTPGYMSLRGEIGGGKLAMYFYGYENSAGHPSGAVPSVLQLPMDWFVSGLPSNEPYLRAENTALEFGGVPLNQPLEKKFRFDNFSRKPLVIDKIELGGNVPEGIFTLSHGALPITIQPGAPGEISVTFKPNEEKEYSETMTIYSNGKFDVIDVELSGGGGNASPNAPKIFSVSELDYGSVAFGQNIDKELTITNMGKSILNVQAIELRDNTKQAFTIIDAIQTPFGLNEGQSHTIRIKFLPSKENETFTARIYYKSNDPKNKDWFVDLRGNSSDSGPGSILSFNVDSVDFGKVKPNFSGSQTVEIKNTGEATLNINMLDFDENKFFAFELVDPMIEAGTKIEPGASANFKIRFKPEDEMEYRARIIVQTNSENGENGVHYLNLVGYGSNQSVNEPIASSKDGAITLKALPHPISANGSIVCEINREMLGSLEVYVVDMSGKRIADLYNGAAVKGSMTLPISSGSNASGQYFVIAKSGSNFVQLPVIFVK